MKQPSPQKSFMSSKVALAFVGLVAATITKAQDLTCSNRLHHLYVEARAAGLRPEEQLMMLTAGRDALEHALKYKTGLEVAVYKGVIERLNFVVISERTIYRKIDQGRGQFAVEWVGDGRVTTPLSELFRKHHFDISECINPFIILGSGAAGMAGGGLSVLIQQAINDTSLQPALSNNSEVKNHDHLKFIPKTGFEGMISGAVIGTGSAGVFIALRCGGESIVRKMNDGFTPNEKTLVIETMNLFNSSIAQLKQQMPVR